MGLGGPVWHASVSFQDKRADWHSWEAQARRVLHGVGDASLGEWPAVGGKGVFHLRRRLSVEEERLVGPVVDIRGTPEAERRRARVLAVYPDLAERLPEE